MESEKRYDVEAVKTRLYAYREMSRDIENQHLRRSDERAVIRVRYIDNASWDEVVDVLFGGKEDLLEREDIYLRRVYKLHGQALLSMAKYIEENETGRSGTGG